MRRVVRAARRRSALTAAGVYVVLSLLVFAPGFAPGRALSASDMLWRIAPWEASAPSHLPPVGSNSELADSVVSFQPFWQTTRASLPHVPLWNPYLMGGRPFVGNAQSAVFSPLSAPAYVLPFWRSLAVIAALKIFIAAFGTYLLGRALGMRFFGALLAGTAFGFSLWMVAWVSWTLSSVWVYLPWLCLLSVRLARRPGPLPFAGLAVIVALQFFAGHPESSFHVLLFAALLWVMQMVAARPLARRKIASRTLWFGGAMLTGAGLAAIQLIPFLELLSHSADLTSRLAQGPSHGPTPYLFGVFLHDYWGRQTRINLVFPFSALQERAYYVGALTLMLAVAAVVLRATRERIVLAVVGLGALAVATGVQPMFAIVTRLPGFDTAQNARLALLFVFCVALLAGWGVDELTGPSASLHRRRLVLAACAALLAFPLVKMIGDGTLSPSLLGTALRISWGFATPSAGSLSPGDVARMVHLASLLEWLALAGAAWILVAVRLRTRLPASAFAVVAVTLVVVDLFKADVGWNPSIPTSHAQQPATGAIRYLQAHGPRRFVALKGPPFTVLPPVAPDVAMRYRVYDARGYDFPVERRYEEVFRRYIAESPHCDYTQCGGSATSGPQALRALGLFGVTYLLQSPKLPRLRAPALPLAYSAADARIYSNPYALPRVFLADRQLVVPDESRALADVTSPSFQRRSAVVTDHFLPGIAAGSPAHGAIAGRAAVDTYDAERVVAHTSSPHNGLLVLTDVYYPGWEATVDGRTTPIHRVDYLLRGVAVPAGAHRIEFRYRPASWRAGVIISGFALLLIIAAVLMGWVRRRSPDAAGGGNCDRRVRRERGGVADDEPIE